MSMISDSEKLRLGSWIVLILLAFNVLAVAAEPPVNIHCPCEIKRINETKVEVIFSLALQKEFDESGTLNRQMIAGDTINITTASYHLLGDANIESVAYSANPVSLQVAIPLNYRPSIDTFISLLLRDSEDSFLDQVNFIEIAEEYYNSGGSNGSVDSKLMVNDAADFHYDDSTFSIKIPSLSSTYKRSSNEYLNLTIAVGNVDGNGEVDALTDGLLILRYLFGLEGDALINGVVADNATRKTASDIEAHLESLKPTSSLNTLPKNV